MFFFWLNELTRFFLDNCYAKKNPNAVNKDWQTSNFTSGLFSMGVYWVFLVVFFGFIAASNNSDIIFTNMEVLFFQNWFFNLNIIFVLVERIYLHQKQLHHPVQGNLPGSRVLLHLSYRCYLFSLAH